MQPSCPARDDLSPRTTARRESSSTTRTWTSCRMFWTTSSGFPAHRSASAWMASSGLVPGIGDVLGGIASCIIIVAAWMRGVPYVTVARMVANVGIEVVVGAIPILGDMFDIAWRANRRNYALLTGSLYEPRKHTIQSWIFLAALCVVSGRADAAADAAAGMAGEWPDARAVRRECPLPDVVLRLIAQPMR